MERPVIRMADRITTFVQSRKDKWRSDPTVFFRDVLDFTPDEWQAEAARDLAHYPKVSIKAGQGVGKTGLEAAVFLWFLMCFGQRLPNGWPDGH